MPNALDHLGNLIQRAHSLHDTLLSLQVDVETPPTMEQVREVRSIYMDWYTDVLLVLPEHHKNSFQTLYISPTNRYDLKSYLYAAQERYFHEEPEPNVEWSYPYSNYEHALSEQTYLLLQAQKELAVAVPERTGSQREDPANHVRQSTVSKIKVEASTLYDWMLEGQFAPNAIMNVALQIYQADLNLVDETELSAFIYRIDRLSDYFHNDGGGQMILEQVTSYPEQQAAESVTRMKQLVTQLRPDIEETVEPLNLGTSPASRVAGLTLPEGYGHLANDCRRFLKDHPDFRHNVFIMTRFGTDRPSTQLDKELRKVLSEYNLNPVRADDKNYSSDRTLWGNVCIYMLCCNYGIALLDDRNADEFNANVALEYGFMRALNRQTLLLADKGFSNLMSVVIGTLREKFDIADIEPTLRPALENWLRDVDVVKPVALVNASDSL